MTIFILDIQCGLVFKAHYLHVPGNLKHICWLNYCLGGEAGGGDEVVELFSALHAPPPGWPPTDSAGDL